MLWHQLSAEKIMKETWKMWQLGLGAGMLFGFGSNAMEMLFPDPSYRVVVKAALLSISGAMILLGYSEVRKLDSAPAPQDVTLQQGD